MITDSYLYSIIYAYKFKRAFEVITVESTNSVKLEENGIASESSSKERRYERCWMITVVNNKR